MNVLLLTHRLPYAPNRGDRVRAYHLLRALQPHAVVDVVSLVHDSDEAGHADDLNAVAASVRVAHVPKVRNLVRSVLALPTSRPTTHSMLDSPDLGAAIRGALAVRRPDVVLAYCSGMARLALAPPLAHLPFVLDMVDVDSAKWEALARVSRPPLGWVYHREGRVLGRFETEAATRAAATLVVTAAERDSLSALAPAARIEVVPNGVDVDALRPPEPAADGSTVIFCGVMNYAPNEQAAVLLARQVWPLVKARCPTARLKIVGAHPTRQVAALANDSQAIEVTGSVPDVRPHLWSSAVAATPIVTARGIQNKVLEAVAAGLPTVVSPNICAGLPPGILAACKVASGAEDFAAAIVALLNLSPAERRELAARADLQSLTWEQRLAAVPGLLREAASGLRDPAHA